MLVTIVLLFGVCWLPLHIFIIIITFNFNFFGAAANTIYFGVHWLSMANSFVNPLIYGFMNESFRADLNSMAHSCLRRRWGHKKLKHRSAALRWKLGDCNVHDASYHVQSRGGYLTKSLHRHELKGNRQKWRNGHTMSTPSLDVAGLCTCELNSVTNYSNMDFTELNPACQYPDRSKTVFLAAGKRRAFTSREREPSSGSSVDDATLRVKQKGGGGAEHVCRNSKLKCRCDPHAGVLFDGSNVVLLQESKRKELG
ncbi:hypothetical protein Btru_025483 [Bulinus truncatus]|nr:hypothetical protein Btru_025483 [Bulinus truncatus]